MAVRQNLTRSVRLLDQYRRRHKVKDDEVRKCRMWSSEQHSTERAASKLARDTRRLSALFSPTLRMRLLNVY